MAIKQKILTVHELTIRIKNYIESDPILSMVLVSGEVSNFSHQSAKKISYFTLKDGKSEIPCVWFSGELLKNGEELIVKGSVRVYEQGGRYQLVIGDVEKKGRGKAYLELEALKIELLEKGYFNKEHKKSLPNFIKKGAIITSRTGAVIKDVLSVFEKRDVFGDFTLFDVRVQGNNIESFINTLKKVDEQAFDVILIVRGGGSFEDFAIYNSKALAISIFEANTPIITGIGHETDTSIADLVADVRASTPTQAAEFVSERCSRQIFLEEVSILMENIKQLTENKVRNLEKNLSLFSGEALARILNDTIQKFSLGLTLEKKALDSFIEGKLKSSENELELLGSELSKLSPLKVLERGYSYVSIGSKGVKDISDVCVGDIISSKFTNFEIKSEVKELIKL